MGRIEHNEHEEHEEHGGRAGDGAPVWPPPVPAPVPTTAEVLARARQIIEVRLAEEHVVVERRVSALERRIAERLTELDQRQVELGQHVDWRVAAIEDRIAEVESRTFQHTSDAIAAIALRIDAIETRCAVGVERLDQLSALSDRLDDVIAAVQIADADRRDELAGFRDQLTNGLRQIDHIEPIRARCASLSQVTAQLQDELTSQRTALADRLAAIDLQLSEVEQAMAGDAMAEISAHLDRLEELERAVAELDPDRFVMRAELRAFG